jgi:hypothetical protein
MRKIFVLLIILLSIASAQAAQVWVEPAYLKVSEGANFTVNISVNPEGAEVYGAQYSLYFNNTLLYATGQIKGNFLGQDGAGTNIFADKINNTYGVIEYGEARTNTPDGVTNPGVLAAITFDVIGKHGVSELVLQDIKLSDPYANEIPGVSVRSGSVEIIYGICGDVNGDGSVNVFDAVKVKNRAGNPGYPLADEWAADVNCDGSVNVFDAVKVKNRAGNPGYSLNCCT